MNTINIAVIQNQTITTSVEVTASGGRAPGRIQARPGAHYLLAETQTQHAPENLVAKRVGKDLHLAFEGSDTDTPSLIIEDFYTYEGQLIGIAEDGQVYEYVADDAEQDHEVAFLLDGGSTSQALGANQLPGYTNGLQLVEGTSNFWTKVITATAAGLGLAWLLYDRHENDRPSAPPKPAITEARDDAAGDSGSIVPDAITNVQQPLLSGAGHQAGNTLEIWINGEKVGDTLVQADGTWTFKPGTVLAEGKQTISAVEVDPDGRRSEPSDSFEFEIDSIAPDMPVTHQVVDDSGSVQGDIAHEGITDESLPTLKGAAEPGTLLHVYVDGELVGTTVVSLDGNWSFKLSEPLADGPHNFTLTATDRAGNISQPSLPRTLIVDTTAPDQPSIDSVIDDVGRFTGNLIAGGDGRFTGNLTTEDGGSITDDSQPDLTGSAEAGSTVIIYDNNIEIARVLADLDGKWSFTPSTGLLDGMHALSVETMDLSGNVSTRSDVFKLNVDTQPPAQPSIDSVIDDAGNVTGSLASGGDGSITDDSRPTLNGSAEPHSTVIIYDNGVEIGRALTNLSGEWTFTPTTDLVDGVHALSVEAVDLAGNVSVRTDVFELNVDTQPPAQPSIDSVIDDAGSFTGSLTSGGDGSITDDSRPTLSGSAEPRSTVIIYDNGVEIGRALTNLTGEWTFTPTTGLLDGVHALSVEAVDLAGNVSARSEAFELNVDTRPPAQPSIDSAIDDAGSFIGSLTSGGDGSITDDTRPALSGSAEPRSTVIIYDNGVEIGRALTNLTGEWTFTPTTGLLDGVHALSVEAVDLAGNVSGRSEVFELNVDTQPPAQPSIDAAIDDAGSFTGSLTSGGDGSITDDSRPTLSGSAEPRSTVIIYDNGVEIGRALTNLMGEWTFTPTTDLLDGVHALSIEAVDLAGNVSGRSETFELNVDTRPPAQPSIDSAIDDAGSFTGSLTSGGDGSITDDTRPALSGSAEPRSTVIIYDNGVEIGRALTNLTGEWTFTPATNLADGVHALSIEAVDLAGNVSVRSEAFELNVDTRPPAQPSIDSAIDDAGSFTGSLTSGGDGSITDDTRPALSGSAEPRSTVIIFDNGVEIGRALTNLTGAWTFTPTTSLADGVHALSIETVDLAGNVSVRSEVFELNVDTRPPAQPSIDSAIDDAGSFTGSLTSGGDGSITDDTRPTLSGSAEPRSTVIIYDNGVEIGRALTNLTGEWTFTPTTDLSDGVHALSIEAVDLAGNVSVRSEAFELNVDTRPPAQPSIDSAIDDAGSITGSLTSGGDGSITDDSRPTLSGSAEPRSTVIIYDNNREIGRVLANNLGQWQFTPGTPLLDGAHALSVEAVELAGNTSVRSESWELNVDTGAPNAPTINSVYDDQGETQSDFAAGETVDDDRPTLNGQAEPDSTVVIYNNGVEIGSTTADSTGAWAFTPLVPLVNGVQLLSAKAIDKAGNISQGSDTFDFTLDNTGNDTPRPLEASNASFSITFGVDTSGSVAGAPLIEIKATLIALVNAYLGVAEKVTFNLIAFSASAGRDHGTFSFTSNTDPEYIRLISSINSMISTGGDAFDQGIALATRNIRDEFAAPDYDPAVIKQVFFLSDGTAPVSGASGSNWQNFIRDPDGDGIQDNPIQTISIAYRGNVTAHVNAVASDGKGIGVPPGGDLLDVILGSVIIDRVTDNLLRNDVQITVDGDEKLTAVTFEGTTLQITALNALVIENPQGGLSATYDASIGLLTIITVDGVLQIYMFNSADHKAGDYTYGAKLNNATGAEFIEQLYNYTVVDSSGVLHEALLTINIDRTDDTAQKEALATAVDQEPQILLNNMLGAELLDTTDDYHVMTSDLEEILSFEMTELFLADSGLDATPASIEGTSLVDLGSWQTVTPDTQSGVIHEVYQPLPATDEDVYKV